MRGQSFLYVQKIGDLGKKRQKKLPLLARGEEKTDVCF
jgi:hypothetical protein